MGEREEGAEAPPDEDEEEEEEVDEEQVFRKRNSDTHLGS